MSWERQGSAFVWVDRADGGVDMVGEFPTVVYRMGGPFQATLGWFDVGEPLLLRPGDVPRMSLSLTDDDEPLGPGPWVG